MSASSTVTVAVPEAALFAEGVPDTSRVSGSIATPSGKPLSV